MGSLKFSRVLLICWVTTASLLVASLLWSTALHHRAYKNAPPKRIIDYPEPRALTLMATVGFYGLIAVALTNVGVVLVSKLRQGE